MRSAKKSTKFAFRQYLIPVDTSTLNVSRNTNLIINPQIRHAISDQSQRQSRKNLSQFIISLYQKIDYVIRPDNYFLLAWQLLLVMIIIYYFLEIGLLVGFRQQFWTDQIDILLGLQIFFVIVLFCDILISPLKSYYDEGLLISDVSQIFRNYMRLQIWIDILAALSILIPLISTNLYSNFVKILWLLKIYTASKINVQFERMTQLYIGINTVYLVIKLIILCYFYSHYMGIGFYLTSLWVYNNNYYGPNTPNLCWIYDAWAYYQMALFLPWTEQYVYIMYFGIAVTTTIAYGDITPKNPIECLYIIVALIAVTIIFGYLMTQILRLLINVFNYNFDRKFVYQQLLNRLKDERIKQTTQIQIRAHAQQINRQQIFRNRVVEDKILNFLPAGPLYGLLLAIYQQFLEQIGFNFSETFVNQNFSPTENKSIFLELFMKDIKQERHYLGDILYNLGQTQNFRVTSHCAYFFTKNFYTGSILIGVGNAPNIIVGKISILNNRKNRSFQLMAVQSMFGHHEFFNGKQRSHWAMCTSNCVLFVASRASLLKYYNTLTQQQKQIVFARMELVQNDKCFVCSRPHFFKECPFAFLMVGNLFEIDQKVRRVAKLRDLTRTRLRTQSSWTIYKHIKNTKLSLTKEYKQKLMQNRQNQSLFIEYQLDEDMQIEQDFQFENELLETEVMINKIYNEEIEDMGKISQQHQYDRVCNYKHYKIAANINNIKKSLGQSKMKQKIQRTI